MVLTAEAVKYHQGIAFLNDYFLNDQDLQQNLVRIPMHDLPTEQYVLCLQKVES